MEQKYEFNAEKEIIHIADEIKKYFVKNTTDCTAPAVIGISGGKDSTIAAALLVRALGPDRVIGVLMPKGQQNDIGDANRVCEILGIKNYTVNIGHATRAVYDAIDMAKLLPGSSCSDNIAVNTNTPARIRMTTLYAIASLVGGRVINTGNASELYVGYTTKYGDLAGDFAIFKNYYVREVLALGDALPELPGALVHKAPADGMSGLTDEDRLGFSYATLDSYLLDGIAPDYDTLRKIEEAHKRNIHKRCINLPSITPTKNILKF